MFDWNLNSVASHNFSKIQSLVAYNCIHKFDIICLSESYLNSETLSSDSNLQIPGYNFARMDHPSNTKRGGVCLYYKCSLPLKVIDVSYLQECINFEVKIGDKTCNFVSLYRSPSQTKDKFENFVKNLELNLGHIANKSLFLIIVLGDFNAEMQGWYHNDITTFEGCKVDIATSQFGLSQIVKEPTHILSNSASCTDLIFTSQPNLVMHSGVHPSLLPNYHHQIVFAKFNITVFYPPPYKRLVWHYQQPNTDLIKRAIELFDVNKHVSVFNEIIMNIFENFIPHETITCNDKDPPWISPRLKRRMVNPKLLDKLDVLPVKLQSLINFFQFKYYRKIQKKYLIHPLVLNAIKLY